MLDFRFLRERLMTAYVLKTNALTHSNIKNPKSKIKHRYLATFTALFSLITVTFICPGKVISFWIF
jgi:hypothetical protein